MAKKIKPEIWCGMIPEIYGYGIMVFETSEDAARKSLKRHFFRWRKSYNGEYNFRQAMENFGGRVFQVELGKCYYDNVGE